MIISATSFAVDGNGDVMKSVAVSDREFVEMHPASKGHFAKNYMLLEPRRKVMIFDGQFRVKQAVTLKAGDWLVFDKGIKISDATRNLFLSLLKKISFTYDNGKGRCCIKLCTRLTNYEERALFKALAGYYGVVSFNEAIVGFKTNGSRYYEARLNSFGSLVVAKFLMQHPFFKTQYEKQFNFALSHLSPKSAPRVPSSFQMRMLLRDIFFLMVKNKVQSKHRKLFYKMYLRKYGEFPTLTSGRIVRSTFVAPELQDYKLITDTCEILDYMYDNHTFVKVGAVFKQTGKAVEVDNPAYIDWMSADPKAKYINYEKHVKRIVFKKKGALERFREKRARVFGTLYPGSV